MVVSGSCLWFVVGSWFLVGVGWGLRCLVVFGGGLWFRLWLLLVCGLWLWLVVGFCFPFVVCDVLWFRVGVGGCLLFLALVGGSLSFLVVVGG